MEPTKLTPGAFEALLWGLAAEGGKARVNGHEGTVISATNGVLVFEGNTLRFDYGYIDHPEYTVVGGVVTFELPEHCVYTAHESCTCHINPIECCDYN